MPVWNAPEFEYLGCSSADAYKDFTNGFTALHWGAKFGKPEIVKLNAGTYGVNPNIKSHGGYTPLHLAAINQKPNIMELLTKTYRKLKTNYKSKLK